MLDAMNLEKNFTLEKIARETPEVRSDKKKPRQVIEIIKIIEIIEILPL